MGLRDQFVETRNALLNLSLHLGPLVSHAQRTGNSAAGCGVRVLAQDRVNRRADLGNHPCECSPTNEKSHGRDPLQALARKSA